MSQKIESVKLSGITGYAFDGGNRRGFPWKNLAEKWVLFREELRKPPVEGEEGAEDFEPDKRGVLNELVFGESATEESMKKFCNFFRNHEAETWGIAQSICDVDVRSPVELVRTEEGNKIVTGAHRFVGACIRYVLAVLAKSPDPIDTIRATWVNESDKEKLKDFSNIENIHRRELLKSSLARQAYEYHLRELSDEVIAGRLSLPNGRQKVCQYRKVYEYCVENNKMHLLDRWDAGDVTLDGLMNLARGKKKEGKLARKKTRTRTMQYSRAYEIYTSNEKLEALIDGKDFKGPLDAVKYGMRIVMQQADKDAPDAATGKPPKEKKAPAEEEQTEVA